MEVSAASEVEDEVEDASGSEQNQTNKETDDSHTMYPKVSTSNSK